MTVIPVYDTYDEPYVVKGLFGQRCVSWLLANWLSTLCSSAAGICWVSFTQNNYSQKDGLCGLNSLATMSRRKTSVGCPIFPHSSLESDIMPHPNPFPISLWNTPTTTKPLTPRKHGIMRAQVAATTAGCLESGHWGFAEQSAMILAKLFWHLFNSPFMFSSGSTLRIKTLSCRTARMMEKPLRVADCCIFCR